MGRSLNDNSHTPERVYQPTNKTNPSSRTQILNIVTHNARTLLAVENLELETEVEKIKWDVIVLSEVRRRG